MNTESITKFLGSLTLQKLVPAVIVLIVGIIVIKGLLKLIDSAVAHSRLDANLRPVVHSVFQIILWAVLVIIVTGTLGINVTSLVALLSVVSLAVSLAVQGALSNIAGGIQVLSAHPYKIGDFVEIGDVSGNVSEIGMVYTRITTLDNKVISIPNSDISSSKVINYTALDKRRVDLKFSASYDAPTAEVRAALIEAANRVGTVFATPPVFARVSNYGDNAIEYTVRAWTPTESYWDSYFDIIENVKTVFDERGIEMTYPHVNVHMMQK